MKQLSLNSRQLWFYRAAEYLNNYFTSKVMSQSFAPVVKPEVEKINCCQKTEEQQPDKTDTESHPQFIYGKTGTPLNSLFI